MANKFSTKLLVEIEAFLTKTEMSPSYFGKKAARNSELVARLRLGRPIQFDTAEKVRIFMVENKDWRKPGKRKELMSQNLEAGAAA